MLLWLSYADQSKKNNHYRFHSHHSLLAGDFSLLLLCEIPGDENYLILKIFIFFEPLFCSLGLWGYLKKRRTVYILTLLFFAANGVLSLTDQVGFFDMVSLLLSTGLFVLLVLQRGDYTGKGK